MGWEKVVEGGIQSDKLCVKEGEAIQVTAMVPDNDSPCQKVFDLGMLGETNVGDCHDSARAQL